MRRLLLVVATALSCSKDPSVSPPATEGSAPPATSGAAATPATPARALPLEPIDEVAVASVPPIGFERLTKEQRVVAFHMTQAALAGDPLLIMQSSKHAWPVTQLVARMLKRSGELDAAFRDALVLYRRQLFLHHGLHDSITSQKVLPTFSKEQFQAAAAKLQMEVPVELLPVIFDPKVAPLQTDKQAKDPIVASAANHYEGVTGDELSGFKDRYELNGRVVKEQGKIVEQVYRAGGDGVPPGLGAKELGRVVEHLQRAAALAPADERTALELLIQYFRTGDNELFRRHDIEWLKQTYAIDYMFGFIETYSDVRSKKGAWQAYVGYLDPDRNGPLQALAKEAAYFERKMPWPDKWKRDSFRTPAAAAVRTVAATGLSGGFGFAGQNLPNAQDLRQTYGTKNFLIMSATDAYRDLNGTRGIDEFVPEEVRGEVARCDASLWYAKLAFHEVTGHGSGKVEPSLKADPAEILGPYAMTMEEGRAQLVADYLIADPKAVEIGLVKDAACQQVAAAAATTDLFTWHSAVPRGEMVEEDHMRAGMIQLGYLLDKGVIIAETRAGKTFLVVKDRDAWHRAVGELLGEHQRIRATGDKGAMKALVDRWGARLNPKWRDEVLARLKALALPPTIALIPPILTPVLGEGGKVVDATSAQATSLDGYIATLEAAWAQ